MEQKTREKLAAAGGIAAGSVFASGAAYGARKLGEAAGNKGGMAIMTGFKKIAMPLSKFGMPGKAVAGVVLVAGAATAVALSVRYVIAKNLNK